MAAGSLTRTQRLYLSPKPTSAHVAHLHDTGYLLSDRTDGPGHLLVVLVHQK
jgi:hypothetical protein